MKRLAFVSLVMMTLCNALLFVSMSASACGCIDTSGSGGSCQGDCCRKSSSGNCTCIDYGTAGCPRPPD